MSRRLAELHGGWIKARSRGLGHGSEFIFSLPLTSNTSHLGGGDQTKHGDPSHSRRVLVVDDNIDAANSLRILLEVMGHDVRMAHDGNNALRQVEDFKAEIVFLDLGLPGMDGLDLGRKIRAMSGTEVSVLVAVTGWVGLTTGDGPRRRASIATWLSLSPHFKSSRFLLRHATAAVTKVRDQRLSRCATQAYPPCLGSVQLLHHEQD